MDKSPGVASGSQNARAATGVGNTALEATGLSVRKGQLFIDLLRSSVKAAAIRRPPAMVILPSGPNLAGSDLAPDIMSSDVA